MIEIENEFLNHHNTNNDNLKISFTVSEIEDMLDGKIIEVKGIVYCIHKHTVMYCRDLDTDIWVTYTGLKGA